MNYETSIIQNSKVIFIKKCDCDNGMESLIELINKLLN